MLGGTITTGGVNYPGLFYAWGRQVIAGIGWEMVVRCLEECGQTLPEPKNDYERRHGMPQIRIDRFVFAALCDEYVLAAGAEVLFHAMLAGVQREEDRWRVTLCTKTGLSDVTARVVIDATGDANAASLAGCALRIPEECQPATLCCHASGYDAATLDLDALNAAFADAVRQGMLVATDAGWNTQEPRLNHWLRNAGENANHLHHINARDSREKSRLELEARQSFLRLYRFLRAQPGLEGLRIEYLAPECGVRETATIVGQATVTVADYESGRMWDDAVCYSFYPIDLHTSDGGGINGHSLQPGVVPTIPRTAMLPVDTENFLVVGRCLSSDRLANSALRVQATAMATGQAAGAMAALTARTGCPVHALPMTDIHTLLQSHGAIVPAGK